jgi:uncharacterized SAM-binding protein YcdF (DUF218 family)
MIHGLRSVKAHSQISDSAMIASEDCLTFLERARQWTKRLLFWGYQAVAAASLLFMLTVLTLKFSPVGTAICAHLMQSTPLTELPDADAIVVLGGDLFRTTDAMRVYRAGKAPLIIVSGESEEALQILDAGQIPRRVVRIDAAPKRTVDHPRTIQAAADIDESSRIILISSKLHQRRALEVFRRAGYEHVWVCSMGWESYAASEKKGRPSPEKVARIFYELGAHAKSWLVD